MNVEEMLNQYDLFDNAILSHGFTDYHRDYRFIAELGRGDGQWVTCAFLFRGCVEVEYRLSIPPVGFSVDDVFIDFERWETTEDASDGYVWGVKYANVYPGWKYSNKSARVIEWSQQYGIPMHEVLIETNVFSLLLIFHDLTVTTLEESVAKVE